MESAHPERGSAIIDIFRLEDGRDPAYPRERGQPKRDVLTAPTAAVPIRGRRGPTRVRARIIRDYGTPAWSAQSSPTWIDGPLATFRRKNA